MEVGGWLQAPAVLPPGKWPGAYCVGGWLGPKARLDGCRISRPPPGIDSRIVQHAASRYTGCAIPARAEWMNGTNFVKRWYSSFQNFIQIIMWFTCNFQLCWNTIPESDVGCSGTHKAYSIYFYHLLIILKTSADIITVGRIGRPSVWT